MTTTSPTTSNETFKSPEELLRESTVVFTNAQQRLDSQITRINDAITDIRKACADQGIILPELDKAMNESNKLVLFKAKMDRYMSGIQNESTPIDRRLALVGVMVELATNIESRG